MDYAWARIVLDQAFDAADDTDDRNSKDMILEAAVGTLLDLGVPSWRIFTLSWTVYFRRVKARIQLGKGS